MKECGGVGPWILILCALFLHGIALNFEAQQRHKAAKEQRRRHLSYVLTIFR